MGRVRCNYGTPPKVNACLCLALLPVCEHRPHPAGYVLVAGYNCGRQTQGFIFCNHRRRFDTKTQKATMVVRALISLP